MRDKPIDQHLALRKVARQGKDAGFGVPVTAATLAEEGARPETAITIGACRLVAPRRRRLAVEVGLQNDSPGIAWFVSLANETTIESVEVVGRVPCDGTKTR